MLTVVFFGTPEFAVPSLEALARDERLRVALVVTQPDRPAGRSRKLTPPPVKLTAQQLRLPVWQPDSLRTAEAIATLSSLNADLFVVAAYAAIFRRAVLELPRCGCLNVHPSLLPRYRGSSPIQAAILNGDAETGVSLIEMVRQLDAGPILAQRRVPLGADETAGELSDRLARLAGELLPEACVGWCDGRLKPQPQDENLASFTARLHKDDGLIDWRDDAAAIERRVRGMAPWPGAWTTLAGRRLVIERATAFARAQPADLPGEITVDGGAVIVRCGQDELELRQVRPEGRGSMAAAAWVRGLHAAGASLRFDLPSG